MHELNIAYSGKQLALAYSDKKEGIDIVIDSELHQGRKLISLNTLVASSRGDVVHYLQSKDLSLIKLTDQFSRLHLPKITCANGDFVLIRLAGANHVHESNCHLIK